jgi:hypothetical protein
MLKNLSLVLVLVAACGKDSGSSGPKAAPIDVAGVNALVPAELKDKLVFEERALEEGRGKRTSSYTLAVPKAWEQESKVFAKAKPPGSEFFFTNVTVGSNCDGECKPKDWAQVSEKENFAQFRSGWNITKDDSTKTSHLMIASKDDRTDVQYAWWADGGRKYYTCSVTLEKELAKAADAFAKACQAVTIKNDN